MHSRLVRGACAAVVAAAALLASPAWAEIEHSTLADGTEGIYITGEIQLGDDAVFRRIADQFTDAVVFLESPGGTVIPALEIGRLARERGYRTVVLAGGTCASSCALIWLAGTPRYLEPGGRVGFHASSAEEDGRLVESGVSNAFVGYYLSKLELSERAVVFTTMASPYELNWLTAEKSEGAGISFESGLGALPAPDPAYFGPSDSLQKAGEIVAADVGKPPVMQTVAAPAAPEPEAG
jgi:membrane-bound ClpP family serine protease